MTRLYKTRKGQYRIVFEMLLILVGIMITAYVAINFEKVRSRVTETTVEDSFTAVSNTVVTGVIKASENPGSAVTIDIPDKVSDHVYKVVLDMQGNAVHVISLQDSGVNVTRQIFNIGKERYNSPIQQVVSSARVVNIVYDYDTGCKADGCLFIRRGN